MNMESNLYYYKATVLRVLDGDTAELMVDLGFRTYYKSPCRFYGINTPETKTKDLEEKKRGMESKEFTKSNLHEGSTIIIKSKDLDKYGRPLVDIYCGEDFSIHLNAVLLDKGLANPLKY